MKTEEAAQAFGHLMNIWTQTENTAKKLVSKGIPRELVLRGAVKAWIENGFPEDLAESAIQAMEF